MLGGSAASTSPRLPGADTLVQRYIAATSGQEPTDLPFYIALGYFKATVIAEGIHARYAQGVTVWNGVETAGAAVPLLAAADLHTLHIS